MPAVDLADPASEGGAAGGAAASRSAAALAAVTAAAAVASASAAARLRVRLSWRDSLRSGSRREPCTAAGRGCCGLQCASTNGKLSRVGRAASGVFYVHSFRRLRNLSWPPWTCLCRMQHAVLGQCHGLQMRTCMRPSSFSASPQRLCAARACTAWPLRPKLSGRGVAGHGWGGRAGSRCMPYGQQLIRCTPCSSSQQWVAAHAAAAPAIPAARLKPLAQLPPTPHPPALARRACGGACGGGPHAAAGQQPLVLLRHEAELQVQEAWEDCFELGFT